MAMHRKQQCNGSHSIPLDAPKFFKIIVNPRDNKLRIPSEFMRRHGRNLLDHVSLKAPNGSVREVQLLRCSDGGTWLHKGWQEFKEYYSLGFGHLLVFIYDSRNSHFDVQIFDMTAIEIEYPHNNANGDDTGTNLNGARHRVPETVDNESSESEDSVVFLKEISTNKKRKGARKSVETADHKDDSPAPKSRRGMASFSSVRAKESLRKKVSVPNSRDESIRASRVKLEQCNEGNGNQSEERVQRTVCKKNCIAYQRAKSFKFCKPFNISIMQPSYVSHTFILSIQFARKVFPNHQCIELKLCNSKGKTWSVKCVVRQDGSKLTCGWRKFVEDNALKVGDACVFEVNKSNPFVWKVTIFRS